MRSLALVVFISLFSSGVMASSAVVKTAVNRLENPDKSPENLILPYLFSTETMGLNLGVGTMASGYYQDQLDVGGTVFGGDVSSAVGAGVWDFQLPGTDRLYFSVYGMQGYYPKQRAYSGTRTEFDSVPIPGSNASSVDDYIEADGSSNWWEMKLEYSLPIGATASRGILTYETRGGLLTSQASGGQHWNPLTSGSTVLVLRQFNRYQSFEQSDRTLAINVHALELGLLYDNTDFPINPSRGSKQYLSVSHNPAWLDSKSKWTFVEFEASKYHSLGESELASQRIIALNFWTGYSSTWQVESNEAGQQKISDGPPSGEGTSLGGFYRMRGYDQHRFHDKASIYSTAEFRYTLKYNPVANIAWLQFLKIDWFQLVPFIELGRVAPKYTASELFSELKKDAGISLRAMAAGLVVRADIATSEEGSNFWVMVNHPF